MRLALCITHVSGKGAIVSDRTWEDCRIHRSYANVKTIGFLFQVSLLVCSVAGCATVPPYYWVKPGVSEEQIRKDNFFCADMTARKPNTYPYSGEQFYSAPLDLPAYRQCMMSRGYQMVSRQDLERGVFPVTPEQRLPQTLAIQNMCQRVIGEAGDISSCIRWMGLSSSGSSP